MGGSVSTALSSTTPIFGLRAWILIAIGIGALIVLFVVIAAWCAVRSKSRKKREQRSSQGHVDLRIPVVSKEITVDRVGDHSRGHAQTLHEHKAPSFSAYENSADMKSIARLTMSKSSDPETTSQCSSAHTLDKAGSSYSGEDGNSRLSRQSHPLASASPLVGLPEFSHLGWGHWFTLRDLEVATNRFSKENIIGEGGYGVVYRGSLVNGTKVAVKRILNNLGQAEKEFRTEVEAIGHVRHKNLVRLLGYCIEGTHRMLVYEYVNNGNLDQWLHSSTNLQNVLTWDSRIKILFGTAKALSYLHEAIEPKVIHRDIKSSNILIDDEFNAKVSDFGLAKLLGSDESHIATRVMGTYGYVAPEYANTGLLNEKSDVYSFGIVLLETVSGRDPVDYSRPSDEVNLVDWLKSMVSSKRIEEIVDPKLEERPTVRSLKRVLLVALKCVDLDSEKRPKMSRIVQMLEAISVPQEAEKQQRKSRTGSIDIESLELNPSADTESNY